MVGTQVELTAVVIEVILAAVLPGGEQLRSRCGWLASIRHFGGGVAADGQNQVIARGRAAEAEVERRIVFLVHQLIFRRRRTVLMAIDLVWQQRLWVVAHVEQGLVVVGPHHVAGGVFQRFRRPAFAAYIAQGDAVLAAALQIFGHRQPAVVLADIHRPQAIVGVAGRALIGVQQGLPRRVGGERLALIQREIFTGSVAFLIAIAVELIRHRTIVRVHAAQHLLIQRGAQLLVRRHHLLGVAVLRLQVVQHLRLCSAVVAQPVVIVGARLAVRRQRFRRALRQRRLRLRQRGAGDA